MLVIDTVIIMVYFFYVKHAYLPKCNRRQHIPESWSGIKGF